MKKIISAIVLAVTLLCSSISVMAADKDVKQNSGIDPLAIATGAVTISLDGKTVHQRAVEEKRYQAEDLMYEIRNNNNEIVKFGSLDSIVTSTPYLIIDAYDYLGNAVAIPVGYQFVLYPKGEQGFTFPYNQPYFVQCEFGNSDAMGIAVLEAVKDDYSANVWEKTFTGSYGEMHYGLYEDPGVKYKLHIYNMNPNSPTSSIYRLNVVGFTVS